MEYTLLTRCGNDLNKYMDHVYPVEGSVVLLISCPKNEVLMSFVGIKNTLS